MKLRTNILTTVNLAPKPTNNWLALGCEELTWATVQWVTLNRFIKGR